MSLDNNFKISILVFWTFGCVLFILVIFHYVALSSNVADLGFFTTNLINTSSQWQRAFYSHIQPLMLIWGAAYHAFPSQWAPLILIATQALTLLASVAVIRQKFGPWPATAMLLYYPFWVNALFDFHFDHLAVPLLTAFFILCQRKRFVWATLIAASLVLIKEPFALQTMACGLYFVWLAFTHRDQGISTRLMILAALLALWGAAWFYAATRWLLPYFGTGTRGALDSNAFNWMGATLPEMIRTLITRPDRILIEILSTPGKLIYLIVIFGLLAFVPLLRPAPLIVALPLLMIAMLSRLPNYYDYATHYTAGVIVPAIVAFRDGLPVARKWFVRLWQWMQGLFDRMTAVRIPASPWSPEKIFSVLLISWLIAGHWAFASSPISRLFWSDKVWSYSWHAYVPTQRTAMMKRAMLTYIPTDPDVSVTTQNTVNWGHLAHRKVYLPFPLGVTEPYPVMEWSNRSWQGLWRFIRTGYMPPAITHDRFADYVVLDLKRPYFIADKGCDWIYGKCRNKEMEKRFLDYVAYVCHHYDMLFEQDGFMILKRPRP